MIKIGDRLREIRKAKGLTGKDLEEKSGIGQSTISRIEQDQHSPSIDTLFSICQALDISLKELLVEDLDQSPPELLRLLDIAKKLPEEKREALNTFLETILRD